MAGLSTPTPELATKLLTEVGYDDRLVGLLMTPMSGSIERTIWSLEEAATFLHIDKNLHQNQASIRYIDFNLLQRWITEVYSDPELASAIGAEVAKYKTYGERVNPVKELLRERLEQCKALISA